jgi:hypothetical protein
MPFIGTALDYKIAVMRLQLFAKPTWSSEEFPSIISQYYIYISQKNINTYDQEPMKHAGYIF